MLMFDAFIEVSDAERLQQREIVYFLILRIDALIRVIKLQGLLDREETSVIIDGRLHELKCFLMSNKGNEDLKILT